MKRYYIIKKTDGNFISTKTGKAKWFKYFANAYRYLSKGGVTPQRIISDFKIVSYNQSI